MNNYKPEGCIYSTALNQQLISSPEGLLEAYEKGIILEARVSVCDSKHNLIVDLPFGKAFIPREFGAMGISDGTTRDVALISRVNKIICFKVIDVSKTFDDKYCAVLSRQDAQIECMENYIDKLTSGDIIDAKITHFEQFGCFVDIGCGIPSLIPIDTISVSRISHPSDRFIIGELIKAAVKSNEEGRICLTHKELLGTWEENAAEFQVGETVSGVVRSIEEYGVFVELAPNLAGLAEPRKGVKVGQNVSVYIKAMIPEKMKVKLIIVDVCEDMRDDSEEIRIKGKYHYTAGHINKWIYSPEVSNKIIKTEF